MQPLILFLLVLLARPSVPCQKTFNPDAPEPFCSCEKPLVKDPDDDMCPVDKEVTKKAEVMLDEECNLKLSFCQKVGISTSEQSCPTVTSQLRCGMAGKLLAENKVVTAVFCEEACATCTIPPILAQECPFELDGSTDPMFVAAADCSLQIANCKSGTYIYLRENRCVKGDDINKFSCSGNELKYDEMVIQTIYCAA